MKTNITGLKPYTSYRFALSLNTTYGLKVIEKGFTEITTIEDTPTSPTNVKITEVERDSLVISWNPSPHKTGIIDKYVIYNYNEEYAVDIVPDKQKDSGLRRSYKLLRLDTFSNYSWSVVACNTAISLCSQKTPANGIFIRTRIGPPSKLKPPTIYPDLIKWEKPERPGGTIDMYQILIVKDEQPGDIFNTTNLSYSLSCEGGVAVNKYQVRAVNFDEDPYHGFLADMEVDLPIRNNTFSLEYPGEWSDSSRLLCRSGDGITMPFILMTVFALVACVVIVYESIQFYKRRKTSIGLYR